MKTVAAVCASSAAKASSSASSVAAGKQHRRPPGDHQGEEEMQACFARLMQLVPTVACTNGRMSKVQLLQHVIDYILDLEYTLDFRPSAESSMGTGRAENADWTAAAAAAAGDGGRTPGGTPPSTAHSSLQPTVDRKPLTENAQVNSSRGHRSAQQMSYFEPQPSITWL